MSVCHFFDIHAVGCCHAAAVRQHMDIVGGAFDGCEACFRADRFPEEGTTFDVAGIRFTVATWPERAGIIAHEVLVAA